MQRTVRLKLTGPTEALVEPMRAFAAACDMLAREVSAGRCKPTFHALNAAYYRAVRERFKLTAQTTQTAMRHVVGTFRALTANGHDGHHPRFKRGFLKLLGTRDRDFRLRADDVRVSIPGARITFKYECRALDNERIALGIVQGATLIERGGVFYLNACVTLPDAPSYNPVTPIGVDRGEIVTLVARAPNAPPLVIQGGHVRHKRRQYRRLRKRLQAIGTHSAKRVLRRLASREQRFELDQARVAAKHVIMYALKFDRPVLVLEDLTGIHDGTKRKGKQNRADAASWAFRQNASCVVNKAEEHGVPVEYVQPAYTSRTCPNTCGDARKNNRNGRSFTCKHCNYRNHSDVVGATNIGRLSKNGMLAPGVGHVNGPNERRDSRAQHAGYNLTFKPPTLVGGS